MCADEQKPNTELTKITTTSSFQQLKEINSREEIFIHTLTYTESYACISVQLLSCEPLLTVTVFLQQPSAF